MRCAVLAATLACAWSVADVRAVQAQDEAAAPVVAIIDFTNSSLVDHAVYEPFRVGIAGMLITELALRPGLVVVERERLRAVLDELDLDASGRLDPDQVSQAGRILGAHYIISGVFVIDRRNQLRIDARAVSVETSRVLHVETVTSDADDLLRSVGRLGAQLSERLDLPAPPPDREDDTRPPDAPPGQTQINLKYARAMLEEDRGSPDRALTLYQEFLAELPNGYAPELRRSVEARVRELRPPGR